MYFKKTSLVLGIFFVLKTFLIQASELVTERAEGGVSGDRGGTQELLRKRLVLEQREVAAQHLDQVEDSLSHRRAERDLNMAKFNEDARAEKHLADLKSMLIDQHMSPMVVDMIIVGLKQYLEQSRQDGISDTVTMQKMDEFLEFELLSGDDDSHDSDEMKGREEKLRDVISAVKIAMIENLDQIIQADLKVLKVQAYKQDISSLVSVRDQMELKKAMSWNDFSQAYEQKVRAVVNKVIIDNFIQQLPLDDEQRDVVQQALSQQAMNAALLTGDELHTDASQRLLNYTQKLNEYFVQDPIDKEVDHRLDMSDDLQRVVNQYRFAMFRKAVVTKLEQLHASVRVINYIWSQLEQGFEQDDILLTTSPDVVFNAVRERSRELLDSSIENIQELERELLSNDDEIEASPEPGVVRAVSAHVESIIDSAKAELGQVREVLRDPNSSSRDKKDAEERAQHVNAVVTTGEDLLEEVVVAHQPEMKAAGWYERLVTQKNMLRALKLSATTIIAGGVAWGIYKGILKPTVKTTTKGMEVGVSMNS